MNPKAKRALAVALLPVLFLCTAASSCAAKHA